MPAVGYLAKVVSSALLIIALVPVTSFASGCNEMYGTSGDDLLVGNDLESGDCIYGLGGDDTIIGMGANDRLVGGSGDDHIDGGPGRDFILYDQSPRGVHLDLTVGIATGWGKDTVVGIENVIGSAFSDVIVGTGRPNSLWGSTGNDVLIGRGADDALHAGRGDDQIDGGNGRDSTEFYEARNGVQVDLRSGTATGLGNDTLSSLEDVGGSRHDDVIDGNADSNSLSGGGGNDVLAGHAADDVLFGAGGDDLLYPGAGNDIVTGYAGRDTLDYHFEAPGPLAISLRSGITTGPDKSDTLDSLERVNGSRFDDTIEGTDEDDTLRGLDGNDRLFGFAGTDVLKGDGGDDDLDGGAGVDTCRQGTGAGGRVRCEL
jgi:Ca2+-binding RTX toxin-like protein